ncbi:MAG: hypothetical protein JW981_06790 [Anaerolineae bacterium]|nr:hypothetical protein [Anaerolineae bacterium]
MSTGGLKSFMARQYISAASPKDLQDMIDTFLPMVFESLSPRQRGKFLKTLLEKHLGTMLKGMKSSDRNELLYELVPLIMNEFGVSSAEIPAILENLN